MRRGHSVLVVACIVALGAIAFGVAASDSGTSSSGPELERNDRPTRSPGASSDGEARTDRLRVPRVVGLDLDEAVLRLHERGLHARFPGYGCGEEGPGGTVVEQEPNPGRTRRESVALTIRPVAICGPKTVDQPCDPMQLEVRVNGMEGYTAGGGGSKVVTLEVFNVGRRICQLDSRGRVRLTEVPGSERVEGNPAGLLIRWAVPAGQSFRAEWTWTNWCGKARGKAVVVGRFAGLTDSNQFHGPIVCHEQGPRSFLSGPGIYPDFFRSVRYALGNTDR